MVSLGTEIEIHGDTELLDKPAALILNSRQGKTPRGNDPWVVNTVRAVNDALENGFTIIASTGMNIWELPLWAASRNASSVIILVPKEKSRFTAEQIGAISYDFKLAAGRGLWLSIPPSPGSRGKKGWWEKRDSTALHLAERIYPISIRTGGKWDAFLNSPEAAHKQIIYEFETTYEKTRKSAPLLPEDISVPAITPWPYLTHWTRRCYGPWPGETSFDFYSDLVGCSASYPRSAFATLRRILRESLLRASPEKIRGNQAVVSFTALAPADAMPLMRWRPRYVKPTFEPYGICINRKAAQDAGIRPVDYLPPAIKGAPAGKALQQGFGKGIWPIEQEWRGIGDLNLNKFKTGDIRIIVPTPDEVEKLQKLTIHKVHTIQSLPDD